MDYSKMGGGRSGSNAPRYDRHKEAPKGKANGKAASGGRSAKADLVARMKAAAEARKPE